MSLIKRLGLPLALTASLLVSPMLNNSSRAEEQRDYTSTSQLEEKEIEKNEEYLTKIPEGAKIIKSYSRDVSSKKDPLFDKKLKEWEEQYGKKNVVNFFGLNVYVITH